MGKGQRELKREREREVGDKKGNRRRSATIDKSRFREFEEVWESTLERH
jgi:hypothetical protein